MLAFCKQPEWTLLAIGIFAIVVIIQMLCQLAAISLVQFLQGMLASLGAPMPGAIPPAAAASAGQPGAGANAPRVEPLNLLGAVDAYMRQLQEGGSEAVTPILVTSLAPRNIEGTHMQCSERWSLWHSYARERSCSTATLPCRAGTEVADAGLMS